MWRILLDGIRALEGSNGLEAEGWTRAVDREGSMSFQNLCEALGVDADALRAAIARGRKKRDPDQAEEARSQSPLAMTRRWRNVIPIR